MWRTDALQFCFAVALDLFLGDPQGWPHLTRVAGGFAHFWEPLCAHVFGRTIFSGIVLWSCVCGTMLSFYFLIRTGLAFMHPAISWIWDAAVIYQTLAARDLDRHARNVFLPLALGDLDESRRCVGFLVGRDTHQLDEVGVSRAAVEAVAESATDGFVAPLLWAALGGAPAALLYRTANTLDSMVGHRSEEYELMGKFSAIADDVLGWVPARLCALASLLPRAFEHAGAVFSDAAKHASPNAGWSEAAAAWALNLKLGGTNFYDGQPFHGPVFNPSAPAPHPNDIPRVLRWFWSIVLLCVLLLGGGLYLRDRQPKEPLPIPPATPAEPNRLNMEPRLQQNFTSQPAPTPVKIHGRINRPANNGTQPTP